MAYIVIQDPLTNPSPVTVVTVTCTRCCMPETLCTCAGTWGSLTAQLQVSVIR